MILNSYETIYIIRPDIIENKNSEIIKKYINIIKDNGAKNILIQNRGRRHLSYNIKNYYDGIYIQMNYNGSGRLINILEKSIKFDNNIIRYLTIKQNKKPHPVN